MRGATESVHRDSVRTMISIHAPHAGSDDYECYDSMAPYNISIHAPHAGSDMDAGDFWMTADISIHAPHAGSDMVRGE